MRVMLHQWCKIKEDLPLDVRQEFNNLGLDSYVKQTIVHLNVFTPDSPIIVKKVFLLKGLIETCLSILRAIISPQRNKYLSEYHEQYEELNLNLGRWWQFIDENEAFMTGVEGINKRKVWGYIEHLYYTFDILIFKPLQASHLKMTREFPELNEQFKQQGRRLMKDYNLFAYFVFCEMLSASKVLGAVTRTKRTVGTREIVHEKLNVMPELPNNIDTEFTNGKNELDSVIDNYAQLEEVQDEQYN